MASTIAPRRNPNYQRKPARWAVLASRLGGLRPMTYEALAHGRRPAQVETANMIRAAISARDWPIVAKLYAPIRAAFQRIVDTAVTSEMEIAEQKADGAEDVRQTEYMAGPCASSARDRIRAIDAAVGRLIEQRMALCVQWGLR